jgi:hypothetical protein
VIRRCRDCGCSDERTCRKHNGRKVVFGSRHHCQPCIDDHQAQTRRTLDLIARTRRSGPAPIPERA